MDFHQIFHHCNLNRTEVKVLQTIQKNPDRCIDEGIRAVAMRCYSNPSTLVRLAKKLNFRGWLELIYFIKFNLSTPLTSMMPEISVIEAQPPEQLEPFLMHLKQSRILIHGSGFSQIVAQYIYNKALTIGIDASLALWPDYQILEQQTSRGFDMVWIISKSGHSHSALSWVSALENKNTYLACFTGDRESPLANAANIAFILHDAKKYDYDIYWPNPFFGYCLLGFEHLLKLLFEQQET